MNNRYISTSKKFHNTVALATLALAVPATAFGGASFDPSWVIAFLQETHRIAGRAIPLLIGVALLVFVWGVVMFMVSNDDRARGEGKRRMVWGVIGLFVIVSVWGLVALLGTLLGIRGATVTGPETDFGYVPTSRNGGGGGGGGGGMPLCDSNCDNSDGLQNCNPNACGPVLCDNNCNDSDGLPACSSYAWNCF
jgi:hypothetical protein